MPSALTISRWNSLPLKRPSAPDVECVSVALRTVVTVAGAHSRTRRSKPPSTCRPAAESSMSPGPA